jgi:8-oxo-dGTP diphosphatase
MSASTLTTVPDGALHVVAAVLVRRGTVFITRRPAGSHLAGKWEFPGGKVHAGESALAALRRELHEETGIDVRAAHPFARVHHTYPEKTVFLDVWRVTAWGGAPHGREGQAIQWAPVTDLQPSGFPEADRPVLRRLQLPPLYAVSDAARLGTAEFLRRLDIALAAGLRLVQVREPHLPPEQLAEFAAAVVVRCRARGAKTVVNAEPALARDCGADGVHLNGRRLHALAQRPLHPDMLVGASCHNAAELAQAERIGADFAVLSPVAHTASHPEAEPLGWDRFRLLSAAHALPVYALGGMRLSDLAPAHAAGAQGIALIRGLWDGIDDGTAATALRESQAAAN